MCSVAASSRSSSRCASIVSGMVILLASSPARGAAGRGGGSKSCLQVAVDEVDLLQAAQALTDVLRADLADALDRLELGGGADHRLLELHLDQPALGAELDDVALDLDRHPGDELGALEHGEHVVERGAALELEGGEAGRDLGGGGGGLFEGRPR